MIQAERYELDGLRTGSRQTAVGGSREIVMGDDSDLEDEDFGSREEESTRLDPCVIRKLDFILLPFLSLLFLLNGLDRANIGNAETAGFSRDTGLGDGDINVAMAAFFAFFVALQPVGAALGRQLGMARWVPACMTLWGLCTIIHIFIRSRGQLIALRIAIACLEAGFYPTTVSYLSLFYTRYEFAVRLGFFYGQNAVAGALGGVLSWAIFSRPDIATGFKPWQLLFLIEGLLTLVVALAGFFWLPHSAADAWFLTAEERSWAEQRIRLDLDAAMDIDIAGHESEEHAEAHDRLLGAGADSSSTTLEVVVTADSGLTRMDLISAFFQYKIWHLLFCNILSAIPATAFGIFLPMVVKQISPALDLSPATSNLLSAPPFIVGAVTLLIFTQWSDRSKRRLLPILCGLLILLIGTAVTVLSPLNNYVLRYTGLCILLSGSFIASPLTVAWLANNTPEPAKRAILLGINGWGNLAGISSAFLFLPSDADNGYSWSFAVTLLCVLLSCMGYLAFLWLLRRENDWRQALVSHWSDDMREREAVAGDVQLDQRFGTDTFAKLCMLLGWDGIRRGDEKMTYRYNL